MVHMCGGGVVPPHFLIEIEIFYCKLMAVMRLRGVMSLHFLIKNTMSYCVMMVGLLVGGVMPPHSPTAQLLWGSVDFFYFVAFLIV